MKIFFFKNRINFLFLFISLICIIAVLGIENISFRSTSWLYGKNDSAFYQLGWYFFQNDIWRFPIGKNPNYGDAISSSIVYTDSIPIFAFLFKLVKPIIPDNFQYFSFWYFLCFYFQLFFSFKIIKNFTGSDLYSFIGAIFFIVSPIFLFKINWHGSAAMGGLLLCTIYLSLTKKINEAKLQWISLIIISSLVEYSSTIIILAIYSMLRIFNFQYNREDTLRLIKDYFLILILLLPTLYISGYFEIRTIDALGVGFGTYKLNLLSPFDPAGSGISWSLFLADIKLSRGEELEGFNYFGLGQMLMIFFSLIFFIIKKEKDYLLNIKNNKKIKIFIIISIVMTLWALSNQISFGSHTLVEIPLNKYIFAALSIAKNTGRMFWVVNYFLLTLSIIIVYQCFSKKISLLILSLFLVIQIIDISDGIKSRLNFFTPVVVEENIILKDPIWENLFKKYKILKTTYPISWSKQFMRFAYSIEKYHLEKTNLVIQARIDRKAAAESRYSIYNNFRKKILSPNTIYVIDSLSHLRNLKYIFKNDDVGFFYRDNFWIMIPNEKNKMSINDKELFIKVEPKIIKINEIKNLTFQEENNYYGFGWSHNANKTGVWSEGPQSTLLFNIISNEKDLKLILNYKPYVTKKNKTLEFDIYTNNILNNKVKVSESMDNRKLEIIIKSEIIKDNQVIIDFKFKNLSSPYDVLESPDARKLGILISNIELKINK